MLCDFVITSISASAFAPWYNGQVSPDVKQQLTLTCFLPRLPILFHCNCEARIHIHHCF